MLEMQNVTKAILEDSQRLREASKEIFNLAKDKAETERIYRTELAKALFIREAEKKPATNSKDIVMINKIGDKILADLKFDRDLAEHKHQAARDSMNALQSNLSALQSILRNQMEV